MLKDATKITKLRLGTLFSGGKDSTFATYIATTFGWDVVCLITIKSENSESYMFHTPNIDLTTYQAQAMGLPLIVEKTSGRKEDELADLYEALKKAKEKYGINGIIVGALASDYQHERVNRVCEELQLKTFAPLWHKDQGMLLKEMIDLGFEICISSVAADGLGEKWLGRKLDKTAYTELMQLHQRIGLHPAGEGGEYESLVLYCPFLFQKKLAIRKAEKVMESPYVGTYKIQSIELIT
ncbi:MAG: diphthine--ammonia ligase [Nanoarchaeota archaeon]